MKIKRMFYLVLSWTILNLFFFRFSSFEDFEVNLISQTLITVVSIVTAIIITYLFSRIFSERGDRIQRKVEIDELSSKITSIRKMASHIRGYHRFWEFNDCKVKSIIEHEYGELRFEDFYNGQKNYEEISKILERVGNETMTKSYLAFKGLEDGDKDIIFRSLALINYSLEDIDRYDEYLDFILYFIDDYKDDIDFEADNNFWINFVPELFYKLKKRNIDKDNYTQEIKKLFDYIKEEVFTRHYYLTKLNTNPLPILFYLSFSSVIIFIILMLLSLILLVCDFGSNIEYLISISLSSLFISMTLDMIYIIFLSVRIDLNIKDFYKI